MNELLYGESYRKIDQTWNTLRVMAKTTPDNIVYVTPGGFWFTSIDGSHYVNYYGGDSPLFSFPSQYQIWVLLIIDISGHLILINGEESEIPLMPILPDYSLPLAGFLLSPTESVITEESIFDLRPILEIAGRTTSTIQRIELAHNGELKYTGSNINFIDSNIITLSISNNSNTDLLDINFSLSKYSPAGTVVSQTNYNQLPHPGVLHNYASSFHSHGTIVNPFVVHSNNPDHSFFHTNINDPSLQEKQALSGSYGEPSLSNPYITEDDKRLVQSEKNFIVPMDIQAYKVINNKLELANINDQILGISISSAVSGGEINIKINGVVENSSWNWSLLSPIYLGIDGVMTQTQSSVQIGIPLTTTSIYLRILDTSTITPTTTITSTTTTTTTTSDAWTNITPPAFLSPTQSWYAHWDGIKWLNDYDSVIIDSYNGAPFYLTSNVYYFSASKIRIEFDIQGRSAHLMLKGMYDDVLVDIPYTNMEEYVLDPTFKIKHVILYSDVDMYAQGIITKIECLNYNPVLTPTYNWTDITSPTYLTPTSTAMSAAAWDIDQWVSNYPSDCASDCFRFIFNNGTFSGDIVRINSVLTCVGYGSPVWISFHDINETYLGSGKIEANAADVIINPAWNIKYIHIETPSNYNDGIVSLIAINNYVQIP